MDIAFLISFNHILIFLYFFKINKMFMFFLKLKKIDFFNAENFFLKKLKTKIKKKYTESGGRTHDLLRVKQAS